MLASVNPTQFYYKFRTANNEKLDGSLGLGKEAIPSPLPERPGLPLLFLCPQGLLDLEGNVASVLVHLVKRDQNATNMLDTSTTAHDNMCT